VCWLPSGSSRTAPITAGAPTSATEARTASITAGSPEAPGSKAPSPHRRRSGRSPDRASASVIRMCRAATIRSPSATDVPGGTRTSTCTAATSSVRPFGVENGSTTGARGRATATARNPRRRRTPPPPATASTSSAATRTTTNVIPDAPATVAKRTSVGSSTWDTPRLPHVNPPNGTSPRTWSITVHRAATPIAPRTGARSRRTNGASAPNRAAEDADSSTSARNAIAPNRKIQYSTAPYPTSPKRSPSAAPRAGPAPRVAHSKNAGATKARGQTSAGGNARERSTPPTTHATMASGRDGRAREAEPTRSPGRTSSSCPPADSGA
jgi:hypothetical protein